ncbi:hypothetical protein ATCV1_z357R [Acanthocystis turfacea chlorella virus 1]|uniref:Uncharacterized protein z357R n=1 Tax=Chlorovirus heliozoae TaxID=322019 RepID=A7K8W7_9PHYC|nr:hypothetical protein ATCV1_z357R [Acanthocystis turfacea chlorella virus 1]ABT16491.1 hypothetical protein ATCV1_z357R [Acanthocystis turfacea chlorella virus 1]
MSLVTPNPASLSAASFPGTPECPFTLATYTFPTRSSAYCRTNLASLSYLDRLNEVMLFNAFCESDKNRTSASDSRSVIPAKIAPSSILLMSFLSLTLAE